MLTIFLSTLYVQHFLPCPFSVLSPSVCIFVVIFSSIENICYINMSVYICLSSQECSTFDCKKNFKVKTGMIK